MTFEITLKEGILNIVVLKAHITGESKILNELVERNYIKSNISKVIFDFEHVEYISSLRIAEFIGIIKYFSKGKNKPGYKFINVDSKVAKIFYMIELNDLADIETK